MRRHLLLGASGFIGRHVALALLRRGEHVLAAGRSAPPAGLAGPGSAEAGALTFVPLDLRDADWDCVLRDGDVVHHYAWSTIPKTANDDPLADLDVNLRGTLRLLEAARRRHGVRIVFASSGGTVYGHTARRPIPETHDLAPVTAYGVSKVAAEKYCGFYRSLHGLDARIARLSNPYGAGQDTPGPQGGRQGAVGVFLGRVLAGQPIEIWGDGSVVRDYLHIDDAVAAMLALADAPADTLAHPPVFNVGSGTGLTLTELVAVLGQRLGRTLPVTRRPGRRFDVAWNVLDVGRAREVLGWTPRLGIAEGIDLMVGDLAMGAARFSTLPTHPPRRPRWAALPAAEAAARASSP